MPDMETMTPTTEKPDSAPSFDAATKRRTLIAMIIGAGLVFLDTSLVGLALPSIQREFHVSTATQQWVASSYLLTLSALMLAGGRLSDLVGRRRQFRVGAAAYAVLATAAALSPNAYVLIGLRAAQGVAGALLVPTTLAIINATFPVDERGKAIGTWAAWSGIATVLGPVTGGIIIDHASWRFALLITPVLAVIAWLLARRVPESRDTTADPRIDFVGIALIVAPFGGIVFALIQGPVSGWMNPLIVGSFVVGVLLLPLFAWWERRAPSPVIPAGMFSNRNLAVANVVTFFIYAGLYGQFFYIPLYVQSALGGSATVAGTLFIPITLLLFFLSPYAGRLYDRYGSRWLMFGGALTAAAGIVLASFTGPGQLFTVLVPGVMLFGLGLGFIVTPVTATAIGSAEERYSGVASGFNNAVARVAGLVAIALMGVIVVQLWQSGISHIATGASADVLAALDPVRDKAFNMPRGTGPASAEASRLAIVAAKTAFRSGMWLAAGLVAFGGIVSAVGIRGKGRGSTGDRG